MPSNRDAVSVQKQPQEFTQEVPADSFLHVTDPSAPERLVDPLASEISLYPAYWRPIPAHWQALDFYRVRSLFPLPEGYESARLDHALKKLLIPGNRTGGKSVYKDLKEAHATLGQWLRENKDALDQ